MTFYYEETDDEGYRRKFKTLRGAALHGCVRLRAYGYLACDRYEGADIRYRRHVVAEWKKDGRVVALVWC